MDGIDGIRAAIARRGRHYEVQCDLWTPSGRLRSAPSFSAFIVNEYLNKSRTIKAPSEAMLRYKVEEQLDAWDVAEAKARAKEHRSDAKAQAREDCEDADLAARETIEALRGILAATLEIDDRIPLRELYDRRIPAAFAFEPPPTEPQLAAPPTLPSRPFFAWLIGSLQRSWEARCAQIQAEYGAYVAATQQGHVAAMRAWESSRQAAEARYLDERRRFQAAQDTTNAQLTQFIEAFEGGRPEAMVEYLRNVFERSRYPEGFFIDHAVELESASQTVVVDLDLPPPEQIPDVVGYKFVASRNESKPVQMKPKEHAALYDEVIKLCVLRTLHEVFEADYTGHVGATVVNGFVTRVNRGTGNEERTCIISVSSQRAEFAAFNLARVDPSECIQRLKGLIAGPLSEVAPVRPILQLDRADHRFVDARDVLDNVAAGQNIAAMPWQEFEHLVRELMSKMFKGEGAEVKVTRASRDGGVDAVAFDPDPIRGGKFVIQAKRYLKVVPVASVRDLYGTMINEGASRGILVTTAHYGRDAREFAKDKPLTLIDGSHLVFLLEQHGYHVRLDPDEARARAREGSTSS